MAENNDFATGYAVGRDSTMYPSYGGYGNGLFGGWGGNDLIALVVILAIFGGGFGGFGGFGGRGLSGVATQADLSAGFAQNTLQRGIDDIILGQSTMQNFINQGFSGLNQSVERGFYSISGQLADCCCATQRAIDGINYNMAKNTCDIIQANANQTQRVLDYLVGEKIDTLNRKLAVAEGQLSQTAQTSVLLNAINRTPTPAYVVPNPYCCTPYTCASVQ